MKRDKKSEQPSDHEETIVEPVMDGATDTFDEDTNPRKGMTDPQLNRDPETGKKTVNPYG